MGPGTGWHEEQPAWYLPLRGASAGPGAALGVALLRLPAAEAPGPGELREHLQAICDLAGAALDRAATRREASSMTFTTSVPLRRQP